MSKFRAGVLALAVIALFGYFGFTKANPFSHPYELNAVFNNVNNLKPNSPVRIAGVEIGKVKKVEPITSGEGAAHVTMVLKDKALPIHSDAQAHVRSRIFLEGNFFVDIQPGSPSAPIMKDGSTIPIQHTSAPVQLGQVLAALQSDTRDDLQVFLVEYSKGLSGKGAAGFNQSIKYWESAYKNSSLANDATLGVDPTRDIQRVLKGQARTFRALNAEPDKLKSLVTDFNTTAGAFARQDVALEASIPALRDTLKTAQPALASLNDALPTLRAFSMDALPGVKSSGPTLDASLPFIEQARLLVRPQELGGTAAVLRQVHPVARAPERALRAALLRGPPAVGLHEQRPGAVRSIHDPRRGRSRQHEPAGALPAPARVPRPRRREPPVRRQQPVLPRLGRYASPQKIQPVPPTEIDQPPPRRPDIPCETQQTPDLHAAKAVVASGPAGGLVLPSVSIPPVAKFKAAPLMKAGKMMQQFEQKQNARENAKAKKAGAKAKRVSR